MTMKRTTKIVEVPPPAPGLERLLELHGISTTGEAERLVVDPEAWARRQAMTTLIAAQRVRRSRAYVRTARRLAQMETDKAYLALGRRYLALQASLERTTGQLRLRHQEMRRLSENLERMIKSATDKAETP